MELLLDSVAVIEKLAVLPGEVVQLIEGEALDERTGLAIPAELLLLRGVRDTGPADEATAGDEAIADARHRITRTIRTARSQEAHVPQRSVHAGIRGRGVGSAPRRLRLNAPELGEDEARIDVDDAIRARAIDLVGVREADFRRGSDAALQPQNVEHGMIENARRARPIIDRREKCQDHAEIG